MNKITRIPIVFLIFLVTPLSSAFNASSDVHSIGSYSMGSAENTLEGTDLTGRNALSYQQGVGGNATSTIHSLNLGGSKQVSTSIEELTTSEETAAGGAASTDGGAGCMVGYELVNGTCAKVEEIPSQLFDITFSLDEILIQSSDELSAVVTAVVTFESFGFEPTPVNLTFIILDESGNEIYREEDSIVVETEKLLRKSFEGLNLLEGKYTLVLQTLYNVDVFDEFRQEFEIGEERKGLFTHFKKNRIWYFAGMALVIILLISLFIIKYLKNKKKRKWEELHSKNLFRKLNTGIIKK